MTAGKAWMFSTLGCPDLGLEEVCELARRWDCSRLELRCLRGRTDLPSLFEETHGTPSRLAETMTSRNVRVHLLDTSFTLIGATDAQRGELLRFVPWAEALRVPWLRVFDGSVHGQPPTPAQTSEAAETVRWWQEQRRRGRWEVDILMETHTACVTAEACLAVEQQLALPLALLWDTHHTWRAGEPVAQTWRALSPHVRHVHVKDSVKDPAGKAGYRYVPPGAGEFPWAELQAAWRQTPYSGTVSLEWEKRWHPELPALEEALAAGKAAGWF